MKAVGWTGKTLWAGLLAGAVLCAASASFAFPSKPITMVVPFAAGGSTDVIARVIGKSLSDALGQPVIVENRTGAGSTVGTNMVAKAAPDGHTLLISTISLAINAGLRPQLPYDTLRDLQPISQIASVPLVLVVNPKKVAARTVGDFIQLARDKPGELNYASSGTGTSPHIAGELFKSLTGTDMVHVPYKGNGPVLNDLLAGHVDAHFGLVGPLLSSIKQGQLIPLAVTTQERLATLPDVPTMEEAGVKGYSINSWQGIFGPAGMPAPVLKQLNEEIVKIVKAPEFQAMLLEQSAQPVGSTPSAFSALVADEIKKWTEIIRQAGASAAD